MKLSSCGKPDSVSTSKLAEAALSAWGHRCHSFYIFSTNTNTSSSSSSVEETPISVQGSSPSAAAFLVQLPSTSDYDSLWRRTQMAVAFIHRKAEEEKEKKEGAIEFDFVLKADDDTFVFADNLADFLRPFDPGDVLYVGHALRSSANTWMSGCAYALSRGAFRAILRGFPEMADGGGGGGGGGGGRGGDIFSKRRRRLLLDKQPEDVAMGMVMTAIRAA